MSQKDSLGDRMKGHYENRTRYLLPRRTYTIIRVDGKAFHAYTKGCERPFDVPLAEDMDFTAVALCRQIEGAQLAYVQSDEISLLVTDFADNQTQAWFDGNLQKLASISASIATAHFNSFRWQRLLLGGSREANSPNLLGERIAYFDSRAFTIPDPVEVENYFIWRQQDATRNSISMTAQAHLPHERLQGKTSDEMQEMLWQEKGINWNDMPGGFKRGRCVVREAVVQDKEYVDKRTGQTRTASGVERHAWNPVVPPVFTRERDWIRSYIPQQRNI
jgi:tRNA(His) guanylyltransferase